MKKIIIILLIVASINIAQTVYEVQFGSKGNEIELTISNTSQSELENVKIKATNQDSWLSYQKEEIQLKTIGFSEEKKVTFKFDVGEEAALMEEKILNFMIESNAQVWNKEIKIKILPPTKFELNQNYPNPFNPTTIISYTIPTGQFITGGMKQSNQVSLKVYDILGREVATLLLNKEQEPGFHKIHWNAGNYASGMYIYQLSMKSANNESKFIRKKMLLMK